MIGLLNPQGHFVVTHKDKHGNVIHTQRVKNGITNGGKDDLLDVAFDAGTQSTTWYFSLIDNSGFTALAAADTMASHSGWTELQSYNEATRVDWNPDGASSQSQTNAAGRTFTINATETVNGIFLSSNSTKGGTTGILWSTASFAATINVVNTDTLDIVYTVDI